MKRLLLFLVLFQVLPNGEDLGGAALFSQVNPCTPNTPTYIVNLTGNPSGTWTSSPPVVRDGSCCGSQWPDRCVVFLITLDTATVAINFNIASGAMPSGAMFYQIDCSAPTPVGQPICLQGPGPYALTFCKPGSNLNTYSITSIPAPSASPNDTIGVGCSTTLSTTGLDPATVTWTSVFPGAQGAYNSYLSCTSGCTTTTVTPLPGAPAFVDYKVCGQSIAPSCLPDPSFCDTIRVYFNPLLIATVSPDPAIFCSNTGGILLTGNASGGDGNYSFQWFNSGGSVIGTSSTYFASAQGTYILQITDGQYPACPPKYDTVVVTSQLAPSVNAGSDQTICSGGSVALIGTVINAMGGIWTGGSGSFNPNNISLNTTYTPNASEIAAGSVTLTLSSTGNGVCPPATDQVTIIIKPPLTAVIAGSSIVCFGATTQLTANVTGGTAPYSFLWNNGSTSQTIIAAPGNYSVTVTDLSSGICTAVATFTVLQDPLVTVSVSPSSSINCSLTTSISATPSGGNGSYSYLWSNGQTSQTIIVTPGIYTVTVTDGVGCTATGTVSVAGINSTLAAVIQPPPNLCNGGTTNITVVATGGFGGYTYQWGTGATSQTINVAAGIYCCTVTDAGGCVTTACVQVNQDSPLQVAISNPSPICNGSMDTISVSASGGQSPYSYQWNTGQTSQSIIQPAGTYSVTVTDANANNCTATATAVVFNEPIFTISVTSNNVSCFGGNDGNATATATGGVPGYTYSWSPSGGTSSSANNLSAGNYTVVVTDNIGCTQSSTINITQPLVLFASISVTSNVNCNGGSNGVATVSVSGGTTPYSYDWSPYGGVNPTATGLIAGTYTVTITDAEGCSNTASATVTQPTVLAATISGTNVSCNSGNNGSATLTTIGGTSPYFYNWSNGGSSATITNLSPGNYSVTVTDNKGCTVIKSVTISQPSVLNASVSSSSNVTCNGAANGSATATGSGGTAPYVYSWSSGISSQTANNLSPGNYMVTITDVNGCTATANVNITQPAVLLASASPDQNITCNTTVTLSSSPSGGTTSYSYQWSNGAVSSSITSNTPGIYVVTVTDANNCTAIDSVIVNSTNSTLNATVSAPANICNGSTTLITANPTGGAGGYTFSWSTGQTSSSINAGAGIFCVTVTDAAGCNITSCVNIQNEPNFSVTITPNATCFGVPQTLTANVTGGIAPYSFLWSTGETTQSVLKNAGIYSVTVTDSIFCTATVTVNVTEAPLLQISFSDVHNVTCFGGNNGTATANPSGGTPAYTYQWSPIFSANASIYGLSAGTYTVTVTDAIGCTATNSVTINQPSTALTIDSIDGSNISCYGGTDGFASVLASGGVSPYNYLWWYDGDTVTVNTNLPAGYYSVSVADTGGCTAIETMYLSQPNQLNLIAGVVAHVSCNGGANGSATAQVSGGTTPYVYQWSNSGNTATITNLTAGNYTVTVTDANGCVVQSQVVQIVQPSSINISPTINNALCTSATGSAIINVTGGTPSYQYDWSTGDTTAIITNVTSGTYNITVTDNAGCIQSQPVVVGTNQANIIITASVTSAICSSATGSAILNVSDGTQPYSFLWSNGAANDTVSNLTAGNYGVTVTDSTGCVQSQTVAISATASTVTLQPTIQQVSCFGGNDGSIFVSATGGAPPYTYTWISPAIAGQTIDSLFAGNYTVNVVDTNTCSATATYNVPQPSALTLTSFSNDITCKGFSDGKISINVSGGTSPYNFNWNPNVSSVDSAVSLPAGIYSVLVTDANGCTNMISDTISEPANVLLANITSANSPSCDGGTDGSATAAATGGVSPYSYLWSNGGVSASLNTLSAGNYSVTVTDANGCTATDSTTISEPPAIVVTSSGDTNICTGQSTTLTVSASGGNGNFTYNWIGIGVGNTQTVSPSYDTIYTVIATDGNGCADTVKISVSVNDTLIVLLNATANDTICEGESVTVSASASGGAGNYIYNWINPPLGTAAGQSISVSPTTTTTYLVQVSDSCSAPVTASVIIVVNPAPNATVNAVPLDGCAPITINFYSNTVGNPLGTTYLWDFGDGSTSSYTNTTHTYTDSGTYLVSFTATTPLGCSTTSYTASEINVYPQPTAYFTASPQPTTLASPEITFVNSSQGAINFLWSFGDETTSTGNSPSFIHTYTDTGTFTVILYATNQYGCPDTFTMDITILPEFQFWIPSAFTPNDNNGKNDYFSGKGICIADYEMYIFDRWGDEIYHTTDINQPWDGRAHGGKNEVQIGVYVYLIIVADCMNEKHKYLGTVTVVR